MNFKKYIFAITMCIAGFMNAWSLNIVEQADSAYNETAYSQALRLYEATLDSIGASSDLYYNIGNTHYRLGDLGRSVLWYERALQLDPTNGDARANLEFVNTRITDKPVDNRSIITRVFDKIANSRSANSWSWLTFAFFVISVVAGVGYLVTNTVAIRKGFFFGGGITIILTILSLIVTLTAANRAASHENAIIVSPSAQLSTAPREATDASTQAFLLHEGTKVAIVDSVIPADASQPRWYEVKIGNSRAWINGKDLERI